jgi:hypothetical protein
MQYIIQNKTQFETVNFRLVLNYILNSQTASCFELYIEFSRCPVFSEFVFYFIFLNCRLVMVIV